MSTQAKWLIGILSFIVITLLFLLILPFMINLNKFKPQIQSMVEQKLNAKIDFTSAKLTILSGLGVELQNVSIQNTDELFMGTELFNVKEIKFKTELFPLLRSKFVGQIEIKNPEIILAKSAGRNNISSLIKKKNNTQDKIDNEKNSGTTHKEEAESTSNSNSSSIDSISNKILIKSFEIRNATFRLINMSGAYDHEVAKIKNMNLIISNIAVGQNTKINFSTEVDLKNDDIRARGFINLNLIANTELEGKAWKNSLFSGTFSLDNLDINFRDAFVKRKGVPFNLSFNGVANPRSVVIDDFKLDLQSIDSKARVAINGFEKLDSDISFSLSSNNLSSLGEIFPKHKQMLLNGTLDLNSKIIGSLAKPDGLIVNLDLKSKLSESDINLLLATNSIKPINGSLKIQSQNLNLGEIVKPFMAKGESESSKKVESISTSKSSKSDSQNKNEAANENKKEEFQLSENEKKFLGGSDFSTNVNIGKMIYENLVLNNFSLNANIKNYTATLNKLSMDIFSGSLSSTATANLANSPVPYNGNLLLNKVKVENIIAFVKPDIEKSPLEGHADIKMSFNAKGTTRPLLSKTLNAKGTFIFSDGTLNTKSLVGLAGQQFNKFVANTSFGSLKIDSDSLKKLSLSENNDSRKNLKNQKGDFEIKDGKLLLRNTIASDDGTLKLNADVGLDESLKGTAIYIASKKIKEQLVAQSKYVNYLLNEKGEFELNLTLGGSVTNPEVGINTSILQARFVKNGSKELSKKIKEEINKNPEVKKIQEDAKKMLEKNGIDLNKLGF